MVVVFVCPEALHNGRSGREALGYRVGLMTSWTMLHRWSISICIEYMSFLTNISYCFSPCKISTATFNVKVILMIELDIVLICWILLPAGQFCDLHSEFFFFFLFLTILSCVLVFSLSRPEWQGVMTKSHTDFLDCHLALTHWSFNMINENFAINFLNSFWLLWQVWAHPHCNSVKVNLQTL